MVERKIISPSDSNYCSPVVMVYQKNKTRLCIDYTRLNKKVIDDVYPIPNQEDILATLGGMRYFTSLDLKAGFLQLPVHPDSKHKTAFKTHQCLWEFNRMPFGAKN